jgi:hypothetical protein
MMDGYKYSAAELSCLTGVNDYDIARILIFLEVKKLIIGLGEGLLPRKRHYVKKPITPIHQPCSPGILPRESIVLTQPQKKRLHLVK